MIQVFLPMITDIDIKNQFKKNITHKKKKAVNYFKLIKVQFKNKIFQKSIIIQFKLLFILTFKTES